MPTRVQYSRNESTTLEQLKFQSTQTEHSKSRSSKPDAKTPRPMKPSSTAGNMSPGRAAVEASLARHSKDSGSIYSTRGILAKKKEVYAVAHNRHREIIFCFVENARPPLAHQSLANRVIMAWTASEMRHAEEWEVIIIRTEAEEEEEEVWETIDEIWDDVKDRKELDAPNAKVAVDRVTYWRPGIPDREILIGDKDPHWVGVREDLAMAYAKAGGRR